MAKKSPSSREKLISFENEFKNQFKIAMIAALGFIVAFSWKDVIASIFNTIIKSLNITQNLYLYQIFSAIIVTIIAVILIIILSKINPKRKSTKIRKR